MRQTESDTKFVFTHIPRTAGTALRRALEEKFGQENLLLDYHQPFSDGPIQRTLKCLVPNPPTKNIPRKIIYGHFLTAKYADFNGWGFKKRSDFRYIVFLREPLERALSQYYFWKHTGKQGNKTWPKFHADNTSLERFLTSRYFSNLQSKFIYGFGSEQFDFVGLQEDYARSLEVLGERFPLFRGLKPLLLNTGASYRETEKYELPPALKEQFKKLNQKDYRLYEKAIMLARSWKS